LMTVARCSIYTWSPNVQPNTSHELNMSGRGARFGAALHLKKNLAKTNI